ncbi:MAG: mechanosensitive ion channel domain-containing protein [Planctomycetaceae bacterium]
MSRALLNGTLLACYLLLAPASFAFEPPVQTGEEKARPKPAQVTAAAVDEARKAAESAELPEEVKKQVLATYDQATTALKSVDDLNAAAAADEERTRTADATLKALQRDIENETSASPDIGAEMDLDSLQTTILTSGSELEKLKRELADLETAAAAAETRRKELATAQSTLSTKLEEARTQLRQAPPADEDPALSNVRRTLAQARIQALEAEGPAITAELARLTAESSLEIPRYKQELKKKKISSLEATIAALKKRQDEQRRDEAEEKQDDLAAIPAGSEAAKLASGWLEKNLKLVETQIPEATRLEQQRAEQLKKDEATEKRIRARVEQFDVVLPVGMELQEQLLKLRDLREIEDSIAERESEFLDLGVARQKNREKLEAIGQRLDESSEVAKESLKAQDSILRTLIRNQTAYVEALRLLDGKERELVKKQNAFQLWLQERVLWIRSNRALGLADLQNSALSLSWLASPGAWSSIPATLIQDAQRMGPLYAAVIGLFLLLITMRTRWRVVLATVGRQAMRSDCNRFQPTLRAVWTTVMLALPWPLLISFIGFRLTHALDGSSFSRAVGDGLVVVGVASLLMYLLKQVCRNEGVGGAHFSWSDSSVKKTRLGLRNMMFVLLPLLFIATALHNSAGAPGRNSLERICLVVALCAISYFSFRLLNPKRGVFADVLNDSVVGWGQRTIWLWYPLSIAIPLLLALLTIFGYFFTSYELSWRLAGTIVLVGIAVVAQAFLARWNLVHERRLRAEQEAELALAAQDEDSDGDTEARAIEEATDLVNVSQQTERLINSGLLLIGLFGLWMLWSQVLPAVSFLTQEELWKTTRQVSVEKVVDGKARLVAETILEPITPLSLIKALFVVIATITAARNLPGLLEMAVLKRLPLDPALRYAIRTVARYLLVIVGVTLTCSLIGIGWSKVQWLVAGLTVGLGFGLQEIFANFVSGLIILFERPVRLGDVVTIDGVSGNVTRIQIRATTITNWDNKEYIVPNKEFVTGRVLNWTLTDPTSRILIKVGVAYGTDTRLARKLLREVAANHPLVIDDPAPLATFEEFGDSTLNLCLRCYIPSLERRLETVTELHTAIDDTFAEQGIEIAFPQLDVNLSRDDMAE